MTSTIEREDEALTPSPPAVVEAAVPATVSAAWELELIIAGAVTFALFQLPGSIDAFREWAAPLMTGIGGFVTLLLATVYAKAVLYVLILAFTTNLVARAYWVGLVGLHSVYPDGVRWERLRMGPVAVAHYRRGMRTLPTLIARVDNFASAIFSFAFLIVLMFVLSVFAFGVFALVAWGLSTLLFGGRFVQPLVYLLAAMLVLPGVIVVMIDRQKGKQLVVDSPAWQRLDRWIGIATRMNGSALYAPILFILMSNAGRRRMTAVFYAVVFGSMAATFTETIARMDLLRAGTPSYVPDVVGTAGIDPAHYESLRAPRRGDTEPTIQSDVIDGPYVRLFIPYRTDRHDYAIRTMCPSVAPLRKSVPHLWRAPDDTAAATRGAAQVLACLTKLSDVRVDGVPVPGLTFRFAEHATSGMPGVTTYIPTAPLAPGAHTLTIAPLPRLPSSTSTRPLIPTTIPFYR